MVIPVGVESQTFTEVTKDKAGRVVRKPLFGVQSAEGAVDSAAAEPKFISAPLYKGVLYKGAPSMKAFDIRAPLYEGVSHVSALI